MSVQLLDDVGQFELQWPRRLQLWSNNGELPFRRLQETSLGELGFAPDNLACPAIGEI